MPISRLVAHRDLVDGVASLQQAGHQLWIEIESVGAQRDTVESASTKDFFTPGGLVGDVAAEKQIGPGAEHASAEIVVVVNAARLVAKQARTEHDGHRGIGIGRKQAGIVGGIPFQIRLPGIRMMSPSAQASPARMAAPLPWL